METKIQFTECKSRVDTGLLHILAACKARGIDVCPNCLKSRGIYILALKNEHHYQISTD
jgi:hypothetical protein